jgi:hypothetical protein
MTPREPLLREAAEALVAQWRDRDLPAARQLGAHFRAQKEKAPPGQG